MVKMVSLSNKAYEELKKLKNDDESFSDIVLKLIQKKDIKKFEGILKDNSKLTAIEKQIDNDRTNNAGRYR